MGHTAVPAQVMANTFMQLDTLAKHSPVNSEKYTAVLTILLKGFESSSKTAKKLSFFWYLCDSISISVNARPAGFQMECIKLQADIHLKTLIISL